jgi:predicted enzyme related to lactoylglutathione lyase
MTSALRWLVPKIATAMSLTRTPMVSMKRSPTAESGDGPPVSMIETSSAPLTPASAATIPETAERRGEPAVSAVSTSSFTLESLRRRAVISPSEPVALSSVTSVERPVAQLLSITFDCADPMALARFWEQVVGGRIDERTLDDDWVNLRDVPVVGHLGFQRVPEGRVVKNRVHLDVEVANIDEAVARLIALGATALGDTVDEGTGWLRVMADPEGNEFCLIVRRSAQ